MRPAACDVYEVNLLMRFFVVVPFVCFLGVTTLLVVFSQPRSGL